MNSTDNNFQCSFGRLQDKANEKQSSGSDLHFQKCTNSKMRHQVQHVHHKKHISYFIFRTIKWQILRKSFIFIRVFDILSFPSGNNPTGNRTVTLNCRGAALDVS